LTILMRFAKNNNVFIGRMKEGVFIERSVYWEGEEGIRVS
jgi:hypothetical protein